MADQRREHASLSVVARGLNATHGRYAAFDELENFASSNAFQFVIESNDAESNSGNQHIPEDQISKIFENIITTLPRDANEDTFRKLNKKHGFIFGKSGQGEMTLLHEIAERRTIHEGHKEFVVWLLKTYPHLRLRLDDENHTAMYVAVSKKNTLAKWILDMDQDIIAGFQETELKQNQVLAEETDRPVQGEEAARRTDTHVHMAIRKGFEFTPLLIAKSQEAIFGFKDMDGNTPLHLAITRASSLPIVELLLERYPNAIFERDHRSQTPYGYLLERKSSPDREAILDTMKSHCLHEKLHQQAIDFLYEGIEERRIVFDLTHFQADCISEEALESLAKHLKFESILQYVELPRLSVKKVDGASLNIDGPLLESAAGGDENYQTPLQAAARAGHLEIVESLLSAGAVVNAAVGGRTALQIASEYGHHAVVNRLLAANADVNGNGFLPKGESRKGLEDFKIIFDWLRKNGVKRIIEVRVRDDGEISHSDEIIENTLKHFNVEALHWMKFDLCSETIFEAAKHVREISLYSSGNNAVLRSWSCKDGLAKLTKLNRVRLSIRQGLESETRISIYVKDFQKRLKTHCENVEFELIEDPVETPAYTSQTIAEQVAPQGIWLDTMDDFRKFIVNVQPDDASLKDVKVAVIDDGIDHALPELQDNIACGVSYHSVSDHPVDYWISPGGHGTQMALLIRRICPHAKLYVARLHEIPGKGGRRQITEDSAIKAIKWAIDRRVHIISMSWTILRTPQNGEKLRGLEEAIQLAHSKNIVMFSAATDQVNFQAVAYPTHCGNTITIGAENDAGQESPYSTNDPVDFFLPGVDVKVKDQNLSGSSIATALAAGLAALICYCIMIASPDPDELEVSFMIMKDIFQRLAGGGKKRLEVWKFFKSDFSSAKSNPEKLEKIEGLVRSLVDRVVEN